MKSSTNTISYHIITSVIFFIFCRMWSNKKCHLNIILYIKAVENFGGWYEFVIKCCGGGPREYKRANISTE